jgi:hypothetical protein
LTLPEEPIHLDLRQGIPFGLLIMELFSLSSKQKAATPPELEVRALPGQLEIHGKGYEEIGGTEAKLNVDLIEILVSQLGGKMSIKEGIIQVHWATEQSASCPEPD